MGGKRPCIPGEVSLLSPRKAAAHSDVRGDSEKSAEAIVPTKKAR